MRAPFGTILLLTMLLGGTYWYTQVSAVCPVPLAYSIGRIDDGFNLTFNEARIAVMDAEAVWENTTGRNLFSYQDDADFTINFIYDDRQERADEEGELKLILDVKENLNEKLEETYSELVSRYNQQELKYKDGREAYERRLNVYNEEVDKYNQEGGAPAGVYDELEERRLSLKAEESQLNAEVKKLNEYVDQINSLGQEGSELINQYNQNVEQYNETFAQEREFTQGDYQYKSINIYTFKDHAELVAVLSHEFGHALSIDHVENSESVMYYLMGGQPRNLVLSPEDVAEFDAVCGSESNIFDRLKVFLSSLY